MTTLTSKGSVYCACAWMLRRCIKRLLRWEKRPVVPASLSVHSYIILCSMELFAFPRAIINHSLLSAILFFWCFITSYNGLIITIEEVPQSLLIPNGQMATFSCKARCEHCLGSWLINNVSSRNEFGRSKLQNMGFTFFGNYSNDLQQHLMIVTIIGSESANGSKIQCTFGSTSHQPSTPYRSDKATLLVIARSPIQVNTSIDSEVTPTHLTLMWSPPFLWPGERISQYSVIILATIMHCQHTITDHWINGNYSDQIVSFAQSLEIPLCTDNIDIFVSAISTSAEHLSTYHVIGQSLSSSLITLMITNISVYFSPDGEPAMVEVYVQVPTCHSMPVRYTIGFDNLVIESGQIQHQYDSDYINIVNDFIKVDLQVNRSYWMNVTTNIYSQNVQVSDQQNFNTSLPQHNSTDKVLVQTRSVVSHEVMVVMICIFIAILLFLALTCVIGCTYWKKKKKYTNIRNGVRRVMVDNPIYDGGCGPVYDSIMTQPESIQSTGSDQKDTSVTNPHYESLNTSKMADTERYIGRPIQPSSNSCHSSSTAYGNEFEAQRVRCNDAPASATQTIGLKSNGQPRNKLGLTLSLNREESTVKEKNSARIVYEAPNISSVELGSEEEPYAIMNPVTNSSLI